MNKWNYKFALIATICALSFTGNSLAVQSRSTQQNGQPLKKVQVSPFSDTLNVNLHQFQPGSMIGISYVNDNDVNITGPASIDPAQFPTFAVTIQSNNFAEDGSPSMTLNYAGTSCQIQFIDGPYSYLSFNNGTTTQPPTCPHMTVGDIYTDSTSQGHNVYHIDLTYQP